MEEWLQASGVPSINAINEDFYETDYRDDTSFPPLRTSGLDVQVTIEVEVYDVFFLLANHSESTLCLAVRPIEIALGLLKAVAHVSHFSS